MTNCYSLYFFLHKMSDVSLVHVRQINSTEFTQALEIYRVSFPPNEKQPEEVIRQRVDSGQSILYCAKSGEKVIGICLLWDFKGCEFMLLDYMAVEMNYRFTGIGSRMFSSLVNKMKAEGRKLVMEVEHPSFGENKTERLKRVNFYLKNGALILRGVPYLLPPLDGTNPTEMLLLLAPAESDEVLSGESIRSLVKRLYAELYGRDENDELLQSFIHRIPEMNKLVSDYE